MIISQLIFKWNNKNHYSQFFNYNPKELPWINHNSSANALKPYFKKVLCNDECERGGSGEGWWIRRGRREGRVREGKSRLKQNRKSSVKHISTNKKNKLKEFTLWSRPVPLLFLTKDFGVPMNLLLKNNKSIFFGAQLFHFFSSVCEKECIWGVLKGIGKGNVTLGSKGRTFLRVENIVSWG